MADAQRLTERQLRRITQKLVGDVALSPEERAATSEHEAWKRDVGEPTARSLITEATGVPGALRSYGDVAADPSLANITDAGVRTALLAFKPALAAKILAASYGTAAVKDSGLAGSILPTAYAQKRQQPEATPSMPGLEPEQNAELAAAKRKVQSGSFSSGAERRAIEATIQRLEDLSVDFVRGKNKSEIERRRAEEKSAQREYDGAVNRADAFRAGILAKDTSFKDSNMGKVYEKTGGFAPLLAGVAGGAIGRAAHGGGGAVKNYAIPAAEGAGLTYAAINAPLLYDAYSTPVRNPERDATEAYARELPPTHPRKAEFTEYARQLPELNPVRESARAELFSVGGQARRALTGVLEGAPAGILGANLLPAGRRGLEAVGEAPGTLVAGYNKGMGRAAKSRAVRAEADLAADEAAAASAEAARRSGAHTAAPASAAEAPMAGQPPSPAPHGNQSSTLPAPVTNDLSLPQNAGTVQHDFSPGMRDFMSSLVDKLSGSATRPAAPSGTQAKKAGDWAARWSDPAREAVTERVAGGGNLKGGRTGLSEPKMLGEIERRLPDGVPPPSRQEVGNRLRTIRSDIGETPSASQLAEYLQRVPKSRFAVPAALGAGYALSAEDVEAAPAITTQDIARRLLAR